MKMTQFLTAVAMLPIAQVAYAQDSADQSDAYGASDRDENAITKGKGKTI